MKKVLATDLDRTLLPNGKWVSDSHAIEMFNKLTEQQDLYVVYVTGRNLNLTEKAIKEYGVRYPDVLCADVGTTIREWKSGDWNFDERWINHIQQMSPKWDASAIKEAVTDVDGIWEQETEHLNPFKQSYYVDIEKKDQVLKKVDEQIKGRFDEVVVYSFDSQCNKGLIDVLPACATKQTALEYVAQKFETPREEVIFCGDSGNDIFPLTAGFRGVLVKNADDQLVENVKKAMSQNSSLQVYFAKGGFKGLNGYYTSGVIEGAYHYGIFNEGL